MKSEHLLAKARAFVASISQLSVKERERAPSRRFGEDYNAFRALVLQQYHQISAIMPPEAEFGGMVDESCVQTFAEFLTWSNQILQLLIAENPQ